jgi:ABC-type sugar transport system substrate-binding protein
MTMKIRSKIKALFLCAVLLCQSLALTSCSTMSEGDVHVFYYNYSDTYVTGVRAALDAQMTAAGLTYQNYDGNTNQTTQTEQIKTAITKGAKVILVNLVNTGSTDAANTIVSAAKGAGIPVIFFNREVPDEVVANTNMGDNPEAAWLIHQNRLLQKELNQQLQQHKTQTAAPPSAYSAYSSEQPDLFLQGMMSVM